MKEERIALARLDEVARAERRKRFRETTPEQRLETSLELSELSRELRAGMKPKS